MPGLCTPSIVFTFIAHYWFFHQNTLNSDALLDPCFKTGYLTCETCYKSMRTLVVEAPVWNPWSRHNFLSPNPSPKRNSSAPFEIRTSFLVEAVQFETRLYQNESSFHHSQPFSSRPPPPYLTTRSKPRTATLTTAKLFPRYNFRYF